MKRKLILDQDKHYDDDNDKNKKVNIAANSNNSDELNINNKKVNVASSSSSNSNDNNDDDVMKCITCSEFFGTPEKDSKCSQCYLPPGETSPYKTNILFHRKKNEKDIFEQTGIHDTHLGICCICLEEKELINNFYCSCIETPCRECNLKVDFCPLCKEGKYYQIEQKHIFRLLDALENTSHERSLAKNRAWIQIMKEIRPKVNEKFTMYQMFAKTSDIDFCVLSKYPNLQHDALCDNFNSIYCLSLFPFGNMKIDLRYVLCYKGPLEVYATYSACKEARKQRDEYGLYAYNVAKMI